MNEPKCCHNPDENKFSYRLKHKLSQWLMWNPLLRKVWVYGWIHLGKYTEYPSVSRWRAGLFEVCASMACGHGLRHGFNVGMIYWRSKTI